MKPDQHGKLGACQSHTLCSLARTLRSSCTRSAVAPPIVDTTQSFSGTYDVLTNSMQLSFSSTRQSVAALPVRSPMLVLGPFRCGLEVPGHSP